MEKRVLENTLVGKLSLKRNVVVGLNCTTRIEVTDAQRPSVTGLFANHPIFLFINRLVRCHRFRMTIQFLLFSHISVKIVASVEFRLLRLAKSRDMVDRCKPLIVKVSHLTF